MLHGRMLRYLDEVARHGSIRRAAKTLHVAASAINRQIIDLESEIGAPIFERMPRGLRLTTAGEVLIDHVRHTLRNHERMRSQILALKGLSRGEITIATMATLAAGQLVDIVAAFRAVHPNVRLNIKVATRTAIVQLVSSGEADLGLGYNLPEDPNLQRAAEYEHRIGAVIAPDHPLVGRRSVRISDCLVYPLVVADRGLSLRDVVENLVPLNAELTPMVETNSMELMKRLARQAPHVTFLNRADVDQEICDGALAFLPLAGAAGRQRLFVVHRSRGSIEPAASRVIQLIEATNGPFKVSHRTGRTYREDAPSFGSTHG
jgi:DNA-binding transcriptional LysR family regulator